MYGSFILFLNFTNLLSSLISIGFSIDLIKTIRNPFERIEDRTRKLVWGISTVLFMYLLSYVIYTSTLIHNHGTIDITGKVMSFKQGYYYYILPGVTLIYTIELIINITSVIVAANGLFIRRGFNRQAKRVIFTRQIFFVMVRTLSSLSDIV